MNSQFSHAPSLNLDPSRKLLIIGCGGHSKVVTEVAESLGFLDISYFDSSLGKNSFLHRKVHSKIHEKYTGYFFVAIGDNFSREQVYNDFSTSHVGADSPILIHPSSIFSSSSSIGFGSIIMPLCVINANTSIGNGVIVNTSSSLDHDSIMNDFSSIAPGVNVGGKVTIGYRSSISIGSSISHGINIGDDVVIGGSSFVLKDITDKCLAYGTPAKYIRPRLVGEKYL
tara:strand:- start:2 stop:682 length:681 start_codon:yes stop_codon:yes gene_type:complete